MKCPKCGYLGFETTDRCRNCQYDFSLTPLIEPDLALQTGDGMPDPTADFELAGRTRQADGVNAAALDLDRLFGAEADPPPPPPMAALDPSALPFDDAPLPAAPRAARPPLSVRRTTPEIPKNRPRTTRPVRAESALAFEGDAAAAPASEVRRAVRRLARGVAAAGHAHRCRPDRSRAARGDRCDRRDPHAPHRGVADDARGFSVTAADSVPRLPRPAGIRLRRGVHGGGRADHRQDAARSCA